MNRVLLIILFVVILTSFSQSNSHNDRKMKENDRSLFEKIMSIEDSAMERWRQGDPMGWAEISAPEITYIDPGLTQPVAGLDKYKEYLLPLKGKVNYKRSIYKNARVVKYGNIAILTYNYTGLGEFDSREDVDPVWNTTEIYCRFGDEWKIIHTHWSYVKHKLPDKVEVPVPIELKGRKYDAVTGELMSLESAAMERWRKGDITGFLELSSPEVTYFDTGTALRINNLEELTGLYKNIEGTIRYDVMEFIDPHIHIHGDTAVLYYRFFSTELNPDGSIKKRVPWNCTEVFAKIDGRWKIVHTHWSYINGERN